MNNFLSTKNHHLRDQNISFDEGPHIYTIDGDSDYKSVTTFVHSHFEHFDADKIIDNMMKNPIKWKKNKYYGKSKQEIKDLWDKNRDEAADAGTKMHYDIECYYNNNPNQNNSIEYQYFNNYLQFHNHLKPYRTEDTPSGKVIMKYNKNTDFFEYYSDRHISNRLLEVVCRGYVLEFNCKNIYTNYNEEFTNRHKVLQKYHEKLKENEKEKQEKQEKQEKHDVFATFKSYNTKKK